MAIVNSEFSFLLNLKEGTVHNASFRRENAGSQSFAKYIVALYLVPVRGVLRRPGPTRSTEDQLGQNGQHVANDGDIAGSSQSATTA
jgi:hypothetical protein